MMKTLKKMEQIINKNKNQQNIRIDVEENIGTYQFKIKKRCFLKINDKNQCATNQL